MARRLRIIALVSVIFFLPFGETKAQRTGNIVEYFGKDRIENTEEGIILHEFTKGWALRAAVRPGVLSGGEDIIAWQVATGKFQRPEDGLRLSENYKNDPLELVWEAIEANYENVFTGNLGRAWLYTELESPEEVTVFLDAKGHTRVFINGMPHEGDHYDFGYTLIPFTLKKGLNQFLFSHGRFGRVTAKIVLPHQEVQFSNRDMTLPALIRGERDNKWGAIRVVNSGQEGIEGYSITCRLPSGETATTQMDPIIAMATRKVKFQVPAPRRNTRAEQVNATLVLRDQAGQEVHRTEIALNQQDASRHHERTFVSNIDGSVQYYSVAPSTSNRPGQAFILSTHGASVEARNQTRAYKQKDWAHIVAPTNRRPFGFNWEEWGRMDALEVMSDAKRIYPTDPAKTYLTGHSMGGHGSWFLGATYPDQFAVIGPAAGYADIIGYRRSGSDTLLFSNPHYQMIYRGAMPGRTLNLERNYLQSGIYVLHGDADMVVSVEQARMMRERLSKFHNNIIYREQPGATHWDGDHAMDWPPLFDFMKHNTIPATNEMKHIEFRTASPGVSATNYWVQVNQQIRHYEVSTVDLKRHNDTISGKLDNVASITLLLSKMNFDTQPVIIVNGQEFRAEIGKDLTLKLIDHTWQTIPGPMAAEKHPARYGGFKLAFTNSMVFVYATGGTAEENEWYKNKARFDAETFLYRGNGSIDIIADTEFSIERFADRNVILYGSASNHKAWDLLLKDAPVRVENGRIDLGDYTINGDNLGTFFIYPRPDSDFASVGVVAGTGMEGMRSLAPNDYFSGITGFPDLLIFDVNWLRDGIEGIRASGFFGNDWSVENGEFRLN
ncbi:MAG: prolyl oligopeptidase family serine peptidase [Bacteroidales bacterium]|nr:prolyl oligopeptidase family serine peptidase [Bacteroidales bacterium]